MSRKQQLKTLLFRTREAFCFANLANFVGFGFWILFLIWQLFSDISVRQVNGKGNGFKREGEELPRCQEKQSGPSMDTRETELDPLNDSRRTDSFCPVENISLEGFDRF